MKRSLEIVAATCALALIAVLVPLVSSAAAEEYETVPARVEVAHWSAGPLAPGKTPFTGRTVRVLVSTGYCLGLPKPVVDHVKLIERPVTAERPFKSAVITTFVRFPEYQRVIPPANPGNVVYNACAGLGLTLEKRIKLRRDPTGMRLFDGGSSPSRPRWPLVRR